MKKAIIIGVGPAGLTAALELLRNTDIVPVLYEATDVTGGISQTKEYKGNRMDIGGHRFFSKSKEVMDFWGQILPFENADTLPEQPAFLIRNRLSRILFLRKFFDYPVTLNGATIKNLGFLRIMRIGLSYLRICLFPPKKIDSLEDFFISRFGKELYRTFFKEYTEKVWGVSCSRISPDWGAQRVKGLSVIKTVLHALAKPFRKGGLSQKKVETSLIEQFAYPKLGPGQLWETVAAQILELGGEIHKNHKVVALETKDKRIASVTVENAEGQRQTVSGEYILSSMPVRELIDALGDTVPPQVKEVSDGLLYRDFITMGLLVSELELKDKAAKDGTVRDNWIYIQENDVKLGRLQIFNNWSPYLVKDPNTVFIGLEYFANEGDELYSLPDDEFANLAISELVKLKIIKKEAVLDFVVVHMPKAYPAYFGSYPYFSTIREFTDKIENLFLIGRNGQHRYNNMDHSMLTAMEAVKNIQNGTLSKENIWAVNAEEEYHEQNGKKEN